VGHQKCFAIIKTLVTGGSCLQVMVENLEGNGKNLKCAGLEYSKVRYCTDSVRERGACYRLPVHF
jgi:hypothetical protein